MSRLKALLISATISLFAHNAYAAGDIKFSTEIGYGQEEEQILLTFDTGKTCELHIKDGFFSKSIDSCIFKPTKRVHTFSIEGELIRENYDETGLETISGSGKSFILNIEDDLNQLKNAQNIDALFTSYNKIISEVNSALPKELHAQPLTFIDKESPDSVNEYQVKHDIALPNVYIEMITKYGYLENFVPLNDQRSIDDIYQNNYEYSIDQFNHHQGIEKNKAFFQEMEDVYYLFHDEAKVTCKGEPTISYTILTEGDYEGLWQNIEPELCGHFFTFLKDHIIKRFNYAVIEANYALPIYKDKPQLEASLSNDELDDNTLYYYFTHDDYDDILY